MGRKGWEQQGTAGSRSLGHTVALPLTSCVTLGKPFTFKYVNIILKSEKQ